jgi:hypothetical protein
MLVYCVPCDTRSNDAFICCGIRLEYKKRQYILLENWQLLAPRNWTLSEPLHTVSSAGITVTDTQLRKSIKTHQVQARGRIGIKQLN